MKSLIVITSFFVSSLGLTADKGNSAEETAALVAANKEKAKMYGILNSAYNSQCSGKTDNWPVEITDPEYSYLQDCKSLIEQLKFLKAQTSTKDDCDDTDLKTALKEAKEACSKAGGKKDCYENPGAYASTCASNSKEIDAELDKESEDRDVNLLQTNFNACPHLAADKLDPDEAKDIRKNIKELKSSCLKEQREAQDKLQEFEKIKRETPQKMSNIKSQASTAGSLELQKLQSKIEEANSLIARMRDVDVIAIANAVNNQDSDIDTECGKELLKTAQESLKKYKMAAARGASGLYSNYMPKVKADAMVAYNTCVQVEGNKSAQVKRQANLEMAKLQNAIAAKVQERVALTQQLNLLSNQMAKDLAKMDTDERNANQDLMQKYQQVQQRAMQDAQKCQRDLKQEEDLLEAVDISANITESRDVLTRSAVASSIGLAGADDETEKKLKLRFGKKSAENFDVYEGKLNALKTSRDSFCTKCDNKPGWAGCGKELFNKDAPSTFKAKK